MTPDRVIDDYLAEVAAALPGLRRARADLVEEMRAGLLDAADAHRSAGLPPVDAARSAVGEFGCLSQIAADLRPELAISYARRTAVIMLTAGLATGLLWLVAAMGSRFAVRLAPPWQWPGLTPAAHLAVHFAVGAFLLAVLAAAATLASTGRLTRWHPARARPVAGAATLACFAAATANLAVGGMLASQLTEAPHTIDPFPVTMAAASSLLTIAFAQAAAHRCLATSAGDQPVRRPHPPWRGPVG